jgi:hypothetical protein
MDEMLKLPIVALLANVGSHSRSHPKQVNRGDSQQSMDDQEEGFGPSQIKTLEKQVKNFNKLGVLCYKCYRFSDLS